jgi:prophage antirepressor-like protein
MREPYILLDQLAEALEMIKTNVSRDITEINDAFKKKLNVSEDLILNGKEGYIINTVKYALHNGSYPLSIL